jgi:hypothetical protein
VNLSPGKVLSPSKRLIFFENPISQLLGQAWRQDWILHGALRRVLPFQPRFLPGLFLLFFPFGNLLYAPGANLSVPLGRKENTSAFFTASSETNFWTHTLLSKNPFPLFIPDFSPQINDEECKILPFGRTSGPAPETFVRLAGDR